MATHYLESLLGEREKVLLVDHQHWFTLLGSIIIEILIIIVLLALTVVAGTNFPQYALIIGAIGTILILIPLGSLLRDVLVWTNRQYIVTNRRVIQISGIYNKNVIDSSLEKVNDVKMAQSALGRLFGYGEVEILTASELGVNLFKRIEDPIRFKTVMVNAKENMEADHDGIIGQDNVINMMATLDQMHKMGLLTDEEYTQKKHQVLSKM
jgi:uncharacterized membrane protein YdbT with pleckstrin-like domain